MDRDGTSHINEEKAHILVVTYPIQGHINPLLQFSKRLASKGPKVTLIIPSTTIRFPANASTSLISVAYIPDGHEEGEILSVDEELKQFRAVVSRTLGDFIQEQVESKFPPTVLVYDAVMVWALDIAREQGLHGAPFFTQSCVVNAIYHLVHHGLVKIPVLGPFSLIPSAPLLEVSELPSLVTNTELYPVLMSMVIGQFSNLKGAKWILVNTFFELEEQAVKWMRTQYPIMTIGPTIPSIYLDQRLEDDKDYGLSLFKPEVEASMKWLDSKEAASVIYVSFGSLASLGEEQMEELAWGLKNSKIHFLWVVRESEKKKLPAGFLDEIAPSDMGLVVGWCSQLEVLAHKAVGCFVTHCGWNSTLEALCLGVPLVAMAQWTDQPTNAKFIEDVWKVGLRVKTGEKGTASREAIEACVREMMEGEKGKEIRRNSLKWRELAKRAVGEGGSSDKNIAELVAELV
ncbi:UDP-glycosyltransferase 74E2-like [Punica granatum]|uniref:Glycosyltransferase n=2 Tax=Punica granatum TaxID=22663 RepID=A0A6P8CLD9_PUNGR|nr:UDP-glycosyltransferase 74E2-like [Punica granatum]